nr:unnamed protein product [Digitaria exilis]
MGDAPAAAAAAAPAASPAGKRRRGDEGPGLRRVAEIVMVLAAAGEVRGGREPTAAERALAAEARERLAAAVAEGAVRPMDLFPGEAVRALVEDLGLNRAKDPAAMGFRPPKASIADRLMLTKRKMEEVKEAPVQPTVNTPQTAVSSGMSEFHGLNGPSKFGVGVPRNPQAATVASTAPLTSTPPVILKPPGSSPVKPVANSTAIFIHPNKSTAETSARSNVNAVQSSNQLLKNQDAKPVAVQAATACLTQSKGKPLPPKYGKVTRTVVASKAAPPGGGAQVSLQGSAENMAAKENHQKLAANGNLMKPISTPGGRTVHNGNVLALSAITAGSQSQLASTLRPPIGNTVKVETFSNGKEGTGQQCSSMIQPDVKSPPNKRPRSDSSNFVGPANDIMNNERTAEISGAEAKIKSEANSEPPVSRDEELVGSSGISVEQTNVVATEENPRAEVTSVTDKMKYGEMTMDTGTSTHQERNLATEERLPSEASSEALTINDVKMTSNSGIPVQQSNIATVEEKCQIDAASDPHRIQDMEIGTDNGPPPIDQSSNFVADVTANAGIPTDQTQHLDAMTENIVKESPSGEPYEDKLGCIDFLLV